MKKHKSSILLLFLCMFSLFLFGQQDCKVLLTDIAGTYEGKCKKGLAHGKGKAIGRDTYEGQFKQGLPNGHGTYSWSTGEVYSGQWNNGERQGEGKYCYTINGEDKVQSGIWDKDRYLGPKPERPQVTQWVGVDKYSINRIGDGTRVLIDIYMNGVPNTTIEAFSILGTSGSEFTLGRSIGYENVIFPFLCKINYRTWNKLHSSQHNVIFEFDIKEPGDWRVVITN